MRRRLLTPTLAHLLLAVLAAPLWAGTVYVPLVVDQVREEGTLVQTEILLTNNSPFETKSFTYYVIPTFSDGTDRPDDSGTDILLQPRSTFILQELVEPGEVAMVEIDADPEISVAARLNAVDAEGTPTLGTRTPVVSSDNLTPAGQPAYLQGWDRVGELVETDFHLVNLGQVETNCTASVIGPQGAIVEDVPISQPALSQRSVPDVLGFLGLGTAEDVSAVFQCDQPFYPYATVHDLETGEIRFLEPSSSGRSTLLPPGETDPPVDGAMVYEEPGTFHVPTVGNERARFDIPMPGNPTFSRIILDMDFVRGPWNQPTNENHSIFWLNRGTRWRSNLFGYFNAFGPGRNIVKLSTNAGLPPGAIQAKDVGVILEEGVRYHVHFEYDTNLNRYEVIVTQNGAQVARIADVATVNTIRTVDENWFIVFGHEPGAVGPEVPTYGWQYANLRIQWVP